MLDALANNPLLQLLALAAAIAAAVWASNHRAHRQRAAPVAGGAPLPRTTASVAHRTTVVQPPALADDRWLAQLLHALHLLVIGHSQGGKTTLIHELATRLAAASVPVIVCDLDATPGLWPGCVVYGYANDLAAINQALGAIRAEVERRRTLRGTGRQRTFPPLYLVIDEYQDVGRASACPLARPLVEDVLRRGGKLNIHLMIGVQDKQVKTMGFAGHGDLRRNFTYVVAVRADRDGRRWATLTDPHEESSSATYGVPALPNLDRLVEAAAHNQSAVTGSACPTPITGQRLDKNWQSEFPATETSFPASERDFIVSDVDFSAEEIAQIAAMIALGGKGKTEVVQAMPRYSGRKHKAYAAYYERVRVAIDKSPDGSCVS